MKKDEYSFLALFGNIDDEYITQALQPWKRQTRRFMIYHIGRKAACLVIIVILGLCSAFHDIMLKLQICCEKNTAGSKQR